MRCQLPNFLVENFQIHKYISQTLLTVAKWNLYQHVFHSILNRTTCCIGILIEYLWRAASRYGTTVHSHRKKCLGAKLGHWPWMTLEMVKRPYKLVYVNKWTTHPVSAPQETKWNTHFVTIGKYGVRKGQWPQMTFKGPRCNVKCRVWSSSHLNLHSSQWQQNTWLKTQFRWKKIAHKMFHLWRHSPVTWPDPVNYLPEVSQRMPRKLCKISARSVQCFGSHFRKAHGGGSINPLPPCQQRLGKKLVEWVQTFRHWKTAYFVLWPLMRQWWITVPLASFIYANYLLIEWGIAQAGLEWGIAQAGQART